MTPRSDFTRVSIGVVAVGAMLAVGACGGDDGPAGPGAVTAVIEAPAEWPLCKGSATVHYSAAASEGPIEEYEWFDGSTRLGTGPELDREFGEQGSFETRLRVSGGGGSDEAVHSVEVVPGQSCPEAVIEGPHTVLVPPGGVARPTYSAGPSPGAIESYTWTLDGEVIASGPSATSVELEFDESELGPEDLGWVTLELMVEGPRGITDTRRLRTALLLDGQCPYEARGDSLVFFSRNRAGVGEGEVGMFLMHYLDGGGRGPMITGAFLRDARLEPCGERIAFTLGSNLALVNRDGTGLRLQSGQEGTEDEVSWGATNWLAYLDDSRGAGPELYLTRPDGALRFPLAGELDPDDFTFRGSNPAWNETGTRLIGGSVLWQSRPPGRLLLYANLWGADLREVIARPLHSDDQIAAAYGVSPDVVAEGISGLAWYRNNVLYTVATTADVTNLYMTDADGSNIRMVVADGIHPTWSPDGQYIIFQRFVDGRGHIFRVPVDGGPAVDLSRITQADADDSAPALIR